MSVESHLSLMKRIRSLANNPRLDKHEKPNRAKVKKKTPADATSINVHHPSAEVSHPIYFGIHRYHQTHYDRIIRRALQY
jgi:hypothetical protein